MAAYPSFYQMVGADLSFDDNRQFVRDMGGAGHASSFYDAPKTNFSIRHKLSTADIATLKTFYTDNLVIPFDFVWALDGVTYSCIFGPGGIKITPSGVWHDVVVDIREV
jgi:hypothetical protein